ncbi:hypothetical protein HIJ39_19410 [Sulfobacillus sp. DSM 109850]|uniref:Uncharacterized protein n=2 Tax=Sulfobacillus harzensis TaxID=2729629 RepID=A0A7Y0L710_9FIRM|nr:hypothetical protein [Sulfobacillus harzensis]
MKHRRPPSAAPEPNDASPWAQVWWATHQLCRTWYREAQHRTAPPTRTTLELQTFQEALAFLRRHYWRSYYWYHGGPDMSPGWFLWAVGMLEAMGLWAATGPPWRLRPLQGVLPAPLTGHLVFTGALGSLVIAMLIQQARITRHIGPFWWTAPRRAQWLLRRVYRRYCSDSPWELPD